MSTTENDSKLLVASSLNLSHDNTITFAPSQASGEPILVLDAQGFVYKGKRIEDAGEAHAAFMAVMQRATVLP